MTGWRRMFVKVYTDEGIVGVELRDDILETAPYHEWRWDLSYNEYK
jgi:hypothetical protein